MAVNEVGVLLVDWENLAGAIIGRGKSVTRQIVDDLWAYANRECGGQLQVHMAAARFDPSIATAMRERFIVADEVRSTKEQADIKLTVLAMDYLHQGCRRFILVTGDQDFIPLIQRLRDDSSEVLVIYGDPNRLATELRQTFATPGLNSVDIDGITRLLDRRQETGSRSLLGLLELQRRGTILGGPEKGNRTATLARWGILPNEDDAQYRSLVDSLAEKVFRQDAAVRAGNDWVAKGSWRTYLDFGLGRMADVRAVDHVVRSLLARPQGLTIASLRTGPFRTDDGTLLDRALDALLTVEAIRLGADNRYTIVPPDLTLGYLEPLWRVYSAVSAECYRREVRSIPYNQVESLLNRGGVGQGKDQRAAGRVGAALTYARAAGVIDVVAVDGKRHAIAPVSALCRPFEHAYHEMYRSFISATDPVPELEVLRFMEDRDRDKADPVFGFDSRDRHRILRILSQSRLITWRDHQVVVQESRWGRAGAPLTRRP
ncbi:NYN domain-containing protein [Micromonospora sp. NPDC051006]|uniref:NYN domain-containing protein n=1 Tax=Micromonospora sp. NPDC051006 TaxID=3364283 RepID=UPI0037AFFE69